MKYTSYLFPALKDGTDRGFQNFGRTQTDAGDIPKRTHTIIKNYLSCVKVQNADEGYIGP